MEVKSNLIQKTLQKVNFPSKKTKETNSYSPNMNGLSSVSTNGVSQVNSSIPISYVKIGEIPIPNVQERASVFKLANGQKIVILPKKGPTFVKTTYNVGSLNEEESIRGISHYIEHNLFNGSKNIQPKEYNARISDMGGYTNASTSYCSTDYYLSLQLLEDNSLEEAIKLNAGLTQYPLFPEDQLQKEKEPVKSEIDMYKDDSYDVSMNLALKNLFNIKTNSDDFILGTKDTINSLTKEKVEEYFNTWYTPDNAVTVITGDVDVNKTIELVSKYYNKKNDYTNINKRHYEKLEPTNKPIRQDIISKNSLNANADLCFAIPEGINEKENQEINMLISILSSTDSSLSKRLDEEGICVSIFKQKMQNKPDGAQALSISLSTSDEKIEKAIKIVYEEINKISNGILDQNILNDEKVKILRAIGNVAETSDQVNSMLTSIILNNWDFDYFAKTKNNTNNITPQDISNTAKKFLDLNKISMCVCHSKNSNPDAIQQHYKNSQSNPKPVSFGANKLVSKSLEEEINQIKEYRLPNNIETRIINGNPCSKSNITVNFRNENLNDVSSCAFSLLSTLLSRGSAFKSNDTMQHIFNQNDIAIGAGSANDGLSFSISFYPEKIQDSLTLFKEIYLNPNFSQEEFDKAKKLLKEVIEQEIPSATNKYNADVYRDIKSLKSTKEERLQELENLTLQDIRNLYSRIISNSKVDSTIIAPVKENPNLVNIYHNELSRDMGYFKPYTIGHDSQYSIYKPNTEAKIYTQATDNNQAAVVQSYTFKELENVNDIAKVNILNKILGAGMSSRLFLDLREKEKLAYKVNSKLSTINDVASLNMFISTTTESPDPKEGSPENINKALKGFQKQVNLLKTQNVTKEELKRAKNSIKTEILDHLETNSDKDTLFTGKNDVYGKNYYKAYLEAIDKITEDDIKAAANHIFKNPPITLIDATQNTLDALKLN